MQRYLFAKVAACGLAVSDFQKIAGLIREFLLKLREDVECSELRDAFNYTLLQLQRYYRVLRAQARHDADSGTVPGLDTAVSPRTPRSEAPDKFTWRWIELDSHNRIPGTLPLSSSRDSPRLPLILRATKQGNNGFITQLLEQGLCCGLLARDSLFDVQDHIYHWAMKPFSGLLSFNVHILCRIFTNRQLQL